MPYIFCITLHSNLLSIFQKKILFVLIFFFWQNNSNSYEFLGSLSYKAMNTAQDVVRCSQCTEAVTHHCKSCQKNLCIQCKDEHIEKTKSTPHEIIPFTSKHHEVQKCVENPTELKTFYCQDCKVPICQLCPTQNHKRHGIEVLKDICENSRRTITEDLNELKNFEVEYSKIIKGLEEKATSYTEHTNYENSLKKLGEELHKSVDREIESNWSTWSKKTCRFYEPTKTKCKVRIKE